MPTVGVCRVPVSSVVFCKMVLRVMVTEADDSVCWLVGVLCISVGVTDDVGNDGIGVVREE